MATWNDASTTWADPDEQWGSLQGALGAAFQYSAFQADAFQAAVPVTCAVAQTLGGFTQAIDADVVANAFIGVQAMGAAAQAATGDLAVSGTTAQTGPGSEEAVAGTLTVEGQIVSETGTAFQADAFQIDAFSATGEALTLPAFTQRVRGGVQTQGTVFGDVMQALAPFDQDADATAEGAGTVSQTFGAASQAASGQIPNEGSISQSMGAFTQEITSMVPDTGPIAQVLGAFTQQVGTALVRWPEWDVTNGYVWPVTTDTEWPVGTEDEWLVRR